MYKPSILYDLLGGKYLMLEPSGTMIVLISSWDVDWFLVASGFPEAHRAPISSHLFIYIWSLVYVLKKVNFLSWIFKFRMSPAVMLLSFA